MGEDKALTRVMENGVRLAETEYPEYLESVESFYMEHKGRSLPEHMVATLGTVYSNVEKELEKKLRKRGQVANETLTTADLGTFIRHGFEVITAALPTSILEEIASVQPMDRSAGKIFWLDYLYDTTKGPVQKGDAVFDAQSGPEPGSGVYPLFSADRTDQEPEVTPAQSGGNYVYDSAGTRQFPIEKETFKVVDNANGDVVVEDDGSGDLVDSNGQKVGDIDYSDGSHEYTIPQGDISGNAELAYSYDLSRNPDATSRVKLGIRDQTIEAEKRQLITNWLIDSAFELERHFGRGIEDEMVTLMGSLVRAEIDLNHLDLIRNSAPLSNKGQFDATLVNFISRNERNRDFKNQIISESTQIEQQSGRGTGNIILAGANVADLLEGIESFDKANVTSEDIAGPHFRGEIWGRRVYKVPSWDPDEYVVMWKGSSFLEAGSVYAPFLPIMMTDTYRTKNMVAEKGLMHSAAEHITNENFFVRNSIITS